MEKLGGSQNKELLMLHGRRGSQTTTLGYYHHFGEVLGKSKQQTEYSTVLTCIRVLKETWEEMSRCEP